MRRCGPRTPTSRSRRSTSFPLDIVPVRQAMRGVTFSWLLYLMEVSDDWKQRAKAPPEKGGLPVLPGMPPMPTSVDGKAFGASVDRTPDTIDFVSRTPGALGYCEFADARKNRLAIGWVQNKSGTFVEPSPESAFAAADTAGKFPDDLKFRFAAAPGEKSYPIVMVHWAMVAPGLAPDRTREVVTFLRWCVHDGQKYLPAAHHGRLPPLFVKRADEVLNKAAKP
jgi:phosphate transport system substrate-binding protein